MNFDTEGTNFLYADQAAAEHAASEYRGVIVDMADALAEMAAQIDSLKLYQFANELNARISNVNF